MPCRHKRCHITIALLGQNRYEVLDNIPPSGLRVSSDPVSMRIETHCHDCGFGSTYNAYGSTDPQAKGATAWPVWLLGHMATLVKVDESLRRACIACRVPGIKES